MKSNGLIIDGIRYAIQADQSPTGADFYVDVHDGRLLHLTNIVREGEISDDLRQAISDNAQFISRKEFLDKASLRKWHEFMADPFAYERRKEEAFRQAAPSREEGLER